MTYLSVAELSRLSGIPRTTVRRWLKEYEEFFITDLNGENVVYHPRTPADLSWIQERREEGLSLDEIKCAWTRKVVISANEAEHEIDMLKSERSWLQNEVERAKKARCVWFEKYVGLRSTVSKANLWQRVFKKW